MVAVCRLLVEQVGDKIEDLLFLQRVDRAGRHVGDVEFFAADDERLGQAARGRSRLSRHRSHLQTAIHRSCDLFRTARWLRLPAY